MEYRKICLCGHELITNDKYKWTTQNYCSKSCWSKLYAAPKLNLYIKIHGSSKKGKKYSLELRKKLSESHKGIQSGINHPMYGKKHSIYSKLKISKALKGKFIGENHYNWQGGKGTERHRLMHQSDYILWRTAVFMKNDYTCQICGKRGGELNADHIKPWALYPELRYAIDNGRTLCVECHRQTDTWGNKGIYRKESD